MLLMVVWFGGMYVIKNLSRWLGYQNADMFAVLFVAIMMFGVLTLVFGGPVYIGIKHGARYGIMTFGIFLGMLTLLAVATLLAYLILMPHQVYYSLS